MNFTEHQRIQEKKFLFPYHYVDVGLENYSRIFSIEYLNRMEVVKDLIKPFKGQLVLDAGCGDGRFCYAIKDENVKIIGVDFSETAINFAKIFNKNINFFIQDLKHLKIHHKCDYIVSIECIEHLLPEDVKMILKNLYNILNEYGKLIITVPSQKQLLRDYPQHYQHFTKESLKETIRPFFEITEILGFSKSNYQQIIFRSMLKLGTVLYLLSGKKTRQKIFNFISNYHKKYVALGNPNECYGLIAVCQKVK
ncbi:class I SAM-dependent methyltransferase [Candidatus Woesearchaeota archaeon]|nr:class I SAM-dependent methyltransferase [Candidatus Woesearchaeota archaeon]